MSNPQTTNLWATFAMIELGWILQSIIHFERFFK